MHSFSIDEAQRRISNWQSEADYLDLSSLNLTELPHNLPVRLKYLRCNCNNITRLPDNLPANLREIYCNNMPLKYLPDSLPENLEILSCNNTLIQFLPETLPVNLRILCCNCTKLSSLPYKLPKKLLGVGGAWYDGLWCYNTNLPNKYQHEPINEYYLRVKGKEREERERTIRRLKVFKEDLIEKTWNTYRVVDWCGVSFDW